MRQRRRKARPIRAEPGASAANPGQLCIWPGNWDTTGGTVLPRVGGDNTSSQVSHAPLTFIEASGTGRASEAW